MPEDYVVLDVSIAIRTLYTRAGRPRLIVDSAEESRLGTVIIAEQRQGRLCQISKRISTVYN